MKAKNIVISFIALLIITFTINNIEGKAKNDITVIKVAGDNNYSPYEYADENGNYKGFNVDIMNALAIELGIEIELIPMEWNDALLALENGEVDAIQGLSKTKERQEIFLFLTETVRNSQAIFVRKETNYIVDINDLSGVKVSFQEGDINHDMLKAVPNIIITSKRNQEQALEALIKGEVDAFVGNRLTGLYNLQKERKSDLVKIVGEPMFITDYGPATLKSSHSVATKLNQGIAAIKENGTYDKIYKKWFGEMIVDSSQIIRNFIKQILVIIIIIIAGFSVVILLNKRLKREVSKRTQEIEHANTDLKRHQARIHNLAYYDTVTDLPNRVLFTETLDEALEESRASNSKLAVFCLDLDRFKHINDTLGHETGDRVLKLVGLRIKKVLNNLGLVSRVGGDEFFIVMPNVTDEESVIKVSESIIDALSISFNISGYDLYVTTSIGISIYPEGGVDIQSLVKNADIAMYKAKDNGGNSYLIYNEELSKQEMENLLLANKLREAIAKNELELNYQPKIDLLSGEVVGMEALLRWHNEKLGAISPARFIPIAEETGLIHNIGEWVLKQACIQNKKWIDSGQQPMRVSVNISTKQFQHQSLVETVSKALAETKLDARYLELEVTESIAVIDITHTIDILQKLKDIGVYISIDDFGTGYSSLNYLKEMSVDELKIDKSFIRDLSTNVKNKAIARTIILLAQELNLQVTAEGVEKLEQVEFLKENKCNKIQGYYYSKPLNSRDFEKFIKESYKD